MARLPEGVGAAASSQPTSRPVSEPELFTAPAAKRRRCELRKEGGYQLEFNTGTAAQNPRAFSTHPLREEQLRSLEWMYSQEARDSFKGGMLADKMGFGKTATTIGLLSEKPGAIPDNRPRGYIRSPATLILCPPHLVTQWEDEFFKFLGDQVQLLHPCAVLAKDKKRMALPPMEFTGSVPFKLAYRVVSELSADLRRCNAQLVPEKRLKVGDHVKSIQIKFRSGRVLQTQESFERHPDDFQKFLEKNCEGGCTVEVVVVREQKPRMKSVRGDGPFRILTVGKHQEWTRLRLGDLLETFNVVLVSTGLLGTKQHLDQVRNTLNDWLCEDGYKCFAQSMSARQEKLRECVDKWHQKDNFLQAALRSAPALFEAVWWNRTVLDEFHESESWRTCAREVMKSLGSTFRWGLSGTPPLSSTDSVLEVAELLWYTDKSPVMLEALKNRNQMRQISQSWLANATNKQRIIEECQTMIHEVVRQNASELVEAIRVEEHEELVQFTAEELLIYRQACHDHGMHPAEQAYAGASIETREALLKRCAHFCFDSDAQDAGEAVHLLGQDRRARIQRLQQQLEIEAARAAHLSVWETAKHGLLAGKELHAEAAQFIRGVHRTDSDDWKTKDPRKKCFEMQISFFDRHGFPRVRPEVRFKQPIRDTEVYPNSDFRHLVRHAVARTSCPQAEQILSRMQMCAQSGCRDPQQLPMSMSAGFQSLTRALEAAHRSLDFYARQMRGLSDIEQLRSEECSVCLMPMDDLASLAMLPCAHIFHRACVLPALASKPQCPCCRSDAPTRSMSSVLLQAEVASCMADTLSPELRPYGSKLLAVARQLEKIRGEDPKAKAIVFVQWQELEKKVAMALRGHGLPVLQLPRGKNSGREMASVMKSFSSEEVFVLLLSLEHAASCSNLTAANHVIFVHPMNAETLDTAVAYERQALARVRRVGQERGTVHVWRFVTKDTIEHHIHQLHCRG